MDVEAMKRVFRVVGRPLFGVLCCAAAALLASVFSVGRPWHGFTPILFVFVIILLSSRYGMIVSVLGSVISALIFAWFLLPPLGSFTVSDPAERGTLAWMLLGGIAIPFLILPPPPAAEVDKTQHKTGIQNSSNSGAPES